MIENLNAAKEELKRIDHLIFVSLKYTRTGDVLINIIKRMLEAYSFLIISLLKLSAKKENSEFNKASPLENSRLVKKIYSEDLVKENIDLYLKLRKILKAEHSRECEYRRHVALICEVHNETVKINIDNISEHFELLKKLFHFTEALIKDHE